MTTELKMYRDAYATMTVAAYEPLIVRWLSRAALWEIVQMYVSRAVPLDHQHDAPSLRDGVIDKYYAIHADGGMLPSIDAKALELLLGRRLERGGPATRVSRNPVERFVDSFPNLAELEGSVAPSGTVTIDGNKVQAAVPIVVSNGAGFTNVDLDVHDVRASMLDAISAYLSALSQLDPDDLPDTAELRSKMLENMQTILGKDFIPGMDFLWAFGDWEESLSPIGIAHFYRQMYFNLDEGVGPIEEAFTIAPKETLEVVHESSRRQTYEELAEFGSGSISQHATEIVNLDDISDKVASSIQRDSSAAMSASASLGTAGGIGVWNVSAGAAFGASTALTSSTRRGTENVSRRLKQTTRRASERITKSFTVRTRDVFDSTLTNGTRRVIANDQDSPVSYGLRRVMRRVQVKVQSLGPRLIWQLYVRDPGKGLARSRFVHYLESDDISDPLVPPATPPRPRGGIDTGTCNAPLRFGKYGESVEHGWYLTLVIHAGADRQITAVSIDSISDLAGGGKEDIAPSARNDVQWEQEYESRTGTFTVNIGVRPGDSVSVQVNYSYVYEPGSQILENWEEQKKSIQAAFDAEEASAKSAALLAKFERERALITERSRIRPRPADDLRREERFEVMNRMVSHLFARSTQGAAPEPLEIELFHRYFDIDALFVYTHPSWWKPRYAPAKTGLGRPAYEITADSEPAPIGSSLGWLVQLDGDTRRNELLNSPWVRVCLPIHPGREREAIAWLAEHVEGTIGYDPKADPLAGLLSDIESAREREADLGVDGPDYVTVSSTVGAPGGALTPQDVFPIVDEFDVTVPTDGFVYDELHVSVP